MTRRTLVFHTHLVQDVTTLRPLIRLAQRLVEHDVVVLCAAEFAKHDSTGLWREELAALCAETGATLHTYDTPYDAVRLLAGRHGMIVAGSESHLPNHAVTHALFRVMPPGFLRVTLQHGFECMGLLHNAAHDETAGGAVRFAADIVVTWFHESRLTTTSGAERPKLYLAGPPTLLEPPPANAADAHDPYRGMVCENLHSVRFVKGGAARQSFIAYFNAFADRFRHVGSPIHLRPHPAGAFTQRQGLPVPEGVVLDTGPFYRIALGEFGFCISAPSTVLFDFVLAGVPVAVWGDADGRIDTSNFSGLAEVVTVEDWWRFVARAAADPQPLLDRQAAFLAGLGMPPDIEDRYARLLSLA